MAKIKPFRAVRPVPEKAKEVSCVPYDVPYDAEVRETIDRYPDSFLTVTRPEALFAEGEKPSAEEALKKSGESFQRLLDEKVLIEDAEPSFFVYRLTDGDHSQTGIIAGASVAEYEDGAIKRHEKTRPDKVEDRTTHMLSLRAQTGLIFLAFRGTEPISQIIKETAAGEPLYDITADDGVRHTVWKVARTEELAKAFEEVPALYIADGHHRAESAALARRKLSAAEPADGDAEYNYVMAGIFPAEDLRILPYNRVVRDLNGLGEDDLFAELRRNFVVSETEDSEPSERGEFAMYFEGKWYRLRFVGNAADAGGPIERLDVSILQTYVLEPILGIDDPRTNERISFVGGSRGVAELERLVDEGEARIAFSMHPTTMDDLFEISDAGEIMPPKSTWFEPKLKDGLVVHRI